MEQYSFSKLQTFHQCKFQYYQSYILDKDDPKRLPKEENAFAQYGTFIHRLLEQYANGEIEVYDLLSKFEDGYQKAVTKEFPPNKYVNLSESYYQQGVDFFRDFDGLDNYEILGVEDDFTENINDDFLIHGFIDLIYRDPLGNLVVHDWKSKSKFKNKKEEKDFRKQLYTYALRIYRKFGTYPDYLRFYLFRNQTSVDAPFSEKEFQDTIYWMKETVEQIRRCEEYPPTYDNFFCSYLCDYRSSCPYVKGGDKTVNRSKKSTKGKGKAR